MDIKSVHSEVATTPGADSAEPRPIGRRWLLVAFVGFAGLAISVLAYWELSTRENQLAQTQFKLDAERRAATIEYQIEEQLNVVWTLEAFYAGSREVERHEFHTFSEPLISEHADIQALGWVPRVSRSERQDYVDLARLEGERKYEILERDTDGRLVPAGERKQYFPVYFVEPREGNAAELGLDLGSMPAVREALGRACEIGQPTATVCTPVESERSGLRMLWVFSPIYHQGEPADSPEPRRESLSGFVMGIFRIGAIVEVAVDYYQPAGIDTYLFDATPGAAEPLLHVHPARLRRQPLVPLKTPPAPKPGVIEFTANFETVGRQLTVYCVPTESFLNRERTRLPMAVLVGVVLLTSMMVGYLVLSFERTTRVEQLVARRTAELHTVSNAALDAVIMMDSAGRVAHWNPAAERMFGYSGEEIVGRQIHDTLMPERYRDKAQKGLKEFVKHGRGAVVGTVHEMEALGKDGEEFPVSISVSGIRVKDQWWVVAIVRDITKRRRAESDIQKERHLLRRLLGLQERERKLLAYEIHDGLAQQLAGAVLRLQAARERPPDQFHEPFDEAIDLLNTGISETRRLIGGLRPPILDESGIVAAIDYLIAQQQNHGGPEIEFDHRVQAGRLAPPLESAVYRIVQESLANAAVHGQTDKVHVELVQHEDSIRLEVRDWGVGFDPTTVEGTRFGLQGIRERARLLGGRAVIDSAPGKGTRITVELPLVEMAPGEAEVP